VFDYLTRYPGDGSVGIYARAYPSLSLLSIGFTDHLGQWDPIVNLTFSELMDLSDDEILSEIREKIGAT
jgi:hypothetical protein